MKNFARAVMAAAPLALVAGMASAGGLAAPVETVAPTPIAPAPAPMMRGSDWTGLYVGGQLGYGEVTISELNNEPVNNDDDNGLTYGAHVGYMYDLGTLVLGGEFEYDLTDISVAAVNLDIDSIMRVKGRVGYDVGAFLPYVTGGVVRATFDNDAEYDGDFYGLGAAYKFSDSLLVGAEVLQHKFYEGDAPVGAGVRATTAAARVSFQF
jgi:outer membrane immunogenic protein